MRVHAPAGPVTRRKEAEEGRREGKCVGGGGREGRGGEGRGVPEEREEGEEGAEEEVEE